MPKGVYGDYKFDLEETPWDRPVNGRQIKDRVARQIGEEPQGAPYIRRNDGSLQHVGADEQVNLGPDDRLGFTGEFETAGGGGAAQRETRDEGAASSRPMGR